MRRWILLIIMLGLTSYSHAHMMGGGMMGANSSPPVPPKKNVAPRIKKGYRLVQTYCVQCHRSPNPAQHSATEWPDVVTRMQHYMRQQHRPVPTATDRKLILDYLASQQQND